MNPPPESAIMLNLRSLAQLFNSMDPSPFVDRDLDADAEEFITSWARELPPDRELSLVINLNFSSPADDRPGTEDAIRRYFSTRAEIKRLEFGQLMRRARLSLGVGSLFLVLCLSLGEFAVKSGAGALAEIVKEGLTIGGWVAMWRPLEIYLYDWWPLYEERRQLERLSRIRVRIVTPEERSPVFAETQRPHRPALARTAA